MDRLKLMLTPSLISSKQQERQRGGWHEDRIAMRGHKVIIIKSIQAMRKKKPRVKPEKANQPSGQILSEN